MVKDAPKLAFAELLANPDAIFTRPGVRILKDSRTSTVAEWPIVTPDGPRTVIVKRVNIRHWSELLKNRFRLSAVLRSWVNGHTLRDRWIPTPRPLAAFHRNRHGLPAEGYLVTEQVPGATGLDQFARGEMLGQQPRSWSQLLSNLARMLRAMHDRAVSHRDLKASNILLDSNGCPVLIDLVGVRVGRGVTFLQRARELARLNASFLNLTPITRTTRLRFLRTYLAAGPKLAPEWKHWWSAIARATAAKVLKNARSGRPLA